MAASNQRPAKRQRLEEPGTPVDFRDTYSDTTNHYHFGNSPATAENWKLSASLSFPPTSDQDVEESVNPPASRDFGAPDCQLPFDSALWDRITQELRQEQNAGSGAGLGRLPSPEADCQPHDNLGHEKENQFCPVVVDKDTENLICFGTLTSLRADTSTGGIWQPVPIGTPLNLENHGALHVSHVESTCAALDARDIEFLELFRREGVEFDLQWMPARPGQEAKTVDRTPIWATLYGPRDLAPDLRVLFEDLELYLQDPLHALRDAAYFNPQRFFNDPTARTTDFLAEPTANCEVISTVKDESIEAIDVLDGLTVNSTIRETAGSSHVLTELKSYQKQGLTFMINRESGWRLHGDGQDVWSRSSDEAGHATYLNNIDSSSHYKQPSGFIGGILADMMGLGKTLSMISLIAHDKVLGKESRLLDANGSVLGKATLIVVPPSLLQNWEDELKRSVAYYLATRPPNTERMTYNIFRHLSAEYSTRHRHHRLHRVENAGDLGFYDIVLTTYNTLANEWQHQQRKPAFSHRWHRVILDEAHEIKDLSTSKARAACGLQADCRWAVTGTPIQNRLSELFSLLHFLRLDPYCEKRNFDDAITNPWLCGDESGHEALAKLLGYIMLRRPKGAIELPKRHDHRRFLQFNTREQNGYDFAKQKVIESLDDALASNRPQQGYSNALQKINALRVICELGSFPRPASQAALSNHVAYGPLLAPESPDGGSTPSSMMEDMDDDQFLFEGDEEFLQEIHQDLRNSTSSQRNSRPISSVGQAGESSASARQWPTKVGALIEDLQKCPKGTKSVVFSYHRSTLDVANMALRGEGICCVQIDGTLRAPKRRQVIAAFSNKEDVRVLLLTLGCGAVGLTLTAASRAYLLEPQWNPALEEQALARIHRLGQNREVTTIRFLISGSIEQYVADIQDGKKSLISLIGSKSATGSQAMAKLLQLRQLLR